MRICDRALNFFQVYDVNGNVRLCSWTRDGHIGNLIDNSVDEVYNSPAAEKLKRRHIECDYSLCKVDACPYLAMGEIEEHRIDVEEIPNLPDSIYIGFEQVCNYACKSCGIHQIMASNKGKDLESNYRIIERRIKEVLPYVKHIGANGCGELFASKHTLRILADWRPIAPINECSVSLETNGSLFDEHHFKQIENLSQYNLRVAISIMSFNEDVYHYLSGTRLPIDNLVNNLKYVRGLREKGIINYLEIATVVQEQNFREMPEFARRCVEEFGADYVRMRPYEWWGECSKDEAWFKDVRNPYHPLYEEYKAVMSHPMIKHPKVYDWGGGLNSEWASVVPSELERIKLEAVTYISLASDDLIERIKESIGNSGECLIYGMSNAGKVLAKKLAERGIGINAIVDRSVTEHFFWRGIPVLGTDDLECDKDFLVIVTPIERSNDIKNELAKRGCRRVIALKELIKDIGLREKLEAL